MVLIKANPTPVQWDKSFIDASGIADVIEWDLAQYRCTEEQHCYSSWDLKTPLKWITNIENFQVCTCFSKTKQTNKNTASPFGSF